VSRVIQYHSAVVHSDAIGNSILALDGELKKSGFESYVSCRDEQIKSAAAGVLPVSSIFEASSLGYLSKDDCLLLHFSFYDEVAERLAETSLSNIIVYHNITPGHFFRRAGNDGLGELCDAARHQLVRMAPHFGAAVGDSEYNSAELLSLDYSNISTIPVLIEIDKIRLDEIDADLFASIRVRSEVNIVFVGRFVPNKCIELVISTLAAFSKAFSLGIKLHLVGKIWDTRYFSVLVDLAKELGVLDKIEFHFGADNRRLRTLFAAADAFAGEHHGGGDLLGRAFAAADAFGRLQPRQIHRDPKLRIVMRPGALDLAVHRRRQALALRPFLQHGFRIA